MSSYLNIADELQEYKQFSHFVAKFILPETIFIYFAFFLNH
jgi:hypothetical protein